MDIAVIVPTYNRADLIGETLESIRRQSLAPAEIIVVDDGSTDQTQAVVASFAPAVKYLRIPNSGECAARNAGVKATRSSWVAFCDSDDLWHPDKLRLQAEVCQAGGVEYCFTNFSTVVNGVWSDSSKFDTAPASYWNLQRREIGPHQFVVETDMFESLLVHQPIFPSTVLMKRSLFEAVGRWSEPLGRTRSVDLEFHLRCVVCPPLGVVSQPVVGIRKHSGNFSSDVYITTLGEIEILWYVLNHHAAARLHEPAIRRTIVERHAMAADDAFAAGDLAKTRELLAGVPLRQRSPRLFLKGMIAHAPGGAAKVLRSLCLRKTSPGQSTVPAPTR